MIAPSPEVATLAQALTHARRLLAANPEKAETQANEILAVVPGHPEAVLVLGVARRRQGDVAGARVVLERLAREQPRAAAAQFEWGLTLAALGEDAAAMGALRRAVALKPGLSDGWRALGDLLTLAGDAGGADAAYAQSIRASVNDPSLMRAGAALCDGDIPVAERLLKAHLKQQPTDVAAMRMLAEVATRLGRYADAEALLTRCLELAPSFVGARHNYAIVLHRQNKSAEAIPHIAALLRHDARDPSYRNLMAATLATVAEYQRAIEIYDGLLKDYPRQPKVWLSYGHALKTAGRRADAVQAYRNCIELAPAMGEAFWSLANLKTEPFAAAEVTAMQAQLDMPEATVEDRLHFHYALGRALEDSGDYAASFAQYAEGARLRRGEVPYNADETSAQMQRAQAFFTPALFAARDGMGCASTAPIFVVGLPRAGSTLIEQILSSHSTVEGTMELPELSALAREMRDTAAGYPDGLALLDAAGLAALGTRYLERTRIYRKTDRPRFIDKMPNNFAHVGLIQLILPHAKIIDARRHPMAAGFSVFKQHFARGQNFSYDLTDIGRYYQDYLALMNHFDAVLPGRVHRVIYEDMVDNTEREVRRLLEYCDLPFEPACLRFWETPRAVRTASSEQVRQPIFREGLNQWRNYERFLGPLKEAL